jgi:hypothetical protein
MKEARDYEERRTSERKETKRKSKDHTADYKSEEKCFIK